MTEYLNLQHPALRASPVKMTAAANELFVLALRRAVSMRLQADRRRLERILGPEILGALSPRATHDDVLEIPLDDARTALVRRILSFGPEGWPEVPWTAIETAWLLDENGRTLVRASDGGDEILFALQSEERDALSAAYASAGIPPDAIEEVDVDLDSLGHAD